MTAIEPNPSLLAGLAGRTTIITGSANGIGAETARLFHSHGANVVIADLANARTAAEELVSSLSTPERAYYIPTNILDWSSMTAMFRETINHFGAVHIVVANAGTMESKSFFELDVDENEEPQEPREAHKVIDINLKGTMNTLLLAMHYLRRNSSNTSSIVLVSSTSGYFGGTGVVSYVASKHGITGLLRASQSTALSAGVRLNAVAPFFTPTHITSSYADAWKEAGLPANTPADVAMAVAQTACNDGMHGRCCLVAGKMMRELEGPRERFTSEWLGADVTDLMAQGKKLFDELGGYPLPKARE